MQMDPFPGSKALHSCSGIKKRLARYPSCITTSCLCSVGVVSQFLGAPAVLGLSDSPTLRLTLTVTLICM